MLKILVKKQLAEVFRGYLYDTKKCKTKSKGKVILQLVLFGILLFVVLGGIFTLLAYKLCGPMIAVDMAWLYFMLMGLVALGLGTFGSVFNSYSGLYKAKDNDLLLSMPIPASYVLMSRLLNVYIMGVMYSIVVMLPTVIVYLAMAGVSVASLIGGIVYMLVISLITMVVSCLIGWFVAKVSFKIKNRSFINLIITVVFLALYFLVVNKISAYIQYLIENAVIIGGRIKGGAYVLYLFGKVGEGDVVAILIYTVVSIALTALTVYILSRSYLKLVTTPDAIRKVKYKAGDSRQGSAFSAAFRKELKRFTSSTTYMLNCGLGVLFMPAFGIYVLVKGKDVINALTVALGDKAGAIAVIAAILLCMIGTMNDMVAPSISLEGKNLWIYKSMPVTGRTVIFAKISLQLVFTIIPGLIASICVAAVMPLGITEKLLCILMPMVFIVLTAFADMVIALRKPNFSWTSEVAPIKQSVSIIIALFGGWVLMILIAVAYFLFGWKIGAAAFMGAVTALFAAIAAAIYVWLSRNANRIIAQL